MLPNLKFNKYYYTLISLDHYEYHYINLINNLIIKLIALPIFNRTKVPEKNLQKKNKNDERVMGINYCSGMFTRLFNIRTSFAK